MYEKYTTEALVLAERARGEYDMVCTLYTRDFGLVHARASALRRTGSKMRAPLTLFSLASVSLVRGARGWRVAGARAIPAASLSVHGAHACARVVQLCVRLIRGEERNEYLFETLCGARHAFAQEETGPVELLGVARILYALGYLSPEALTSTFFVHTAFADSDLRAVESERGTVIKTINTAIAESQL